MARIQFSHVSKVYYSGTEAVKNFNMEVEDGEMVVIAGSSGCGKSTVLRMVAGLEEPTTGELIIDGQVVNELEPKKRNVAMVFQNYALFPNLSVADNLGFALKMQRVPRQERNDRVEAMAQTLGIQDLLQRKAKGLSGGQCQRISIGRALVCEPKVFLLDEPLSRLDSGMRNALRNQITELQQRLKVTTLYVTHDQTEMMTLGSRVVLMDQGEIQQIDPPQDIYLKPRNTFVAGFLGSNPMNLFEAECFSRGQDVMLRIGSQEILLPAWKSRILRMRGYGDKPVTAGLRSEDIYPDSEGTRAPDVTLARLSVRVDSIDVLGSEMKLHLMAEDVPLATMARIFAKVQPGDVLDVDIAVDQIHIFDRETGETVTH